LQYLEQGHSGPLERSAQDEGQFDFDSRRDEAFERHVAAGLEEHVIHQWCIVGLGDLRCHLHGARRQSDLAAADAAAVGLLQLHPFTLDGIAVLHRHAGVLPGEMPQLRAVLARFIQPSCERAYGFIGQHGGCFCGYSSWFGFRLF
jgi:hypothetical protein